MEPCAGDGCSKLADLHCEKCNASFCRPCFAQEHQGRLAKHTPVPWKAFRGLYFIPTEEDIINTHATSNLIRYDLEALRIALGPKFYHIDHVEMDELMTVVSFIGPTGVGKSLTIRNLCAEGTDLPLPADPKVTTSFSSDVGAYNGIGKNLILDFEGTNGQIENRTLTTLYGNMPGFNDSTRKNFVDQIYPRIAYLFSDVLCFNFSGSPKEVRNYVPLLESYAQFGLARSINTRKPSLVMIFHKVTLDEGKWEIDDASTSWLAQGDTKKLALYYRSIKCIHIPDKYHLSLYFQQIEQLKKLIFDQGKTQHSKRQFLHFLERAAYRFSVDMDSTIDFVQLSLYFRPMPSELSEYLVEFFHRVRQHLEVELKKSKHESYKEALQILATRFIDSVRVHLDRDLHTSMDNTALPPIVKAELEKVQDAIRSFRPCAAKRHFDGLEEVVHCENDAGTHENHQSHRTYPLQVKTFWILSTHTTMQAPCVWEGAYEPMPCSTLEDLVNKSLVDMVTKDDRRVSEEHARTLEEQAPILKQLKTRRTCFACLLEIPTEVLSSCQHLICHKCCEEFSNRDGSIKCPLCLVSSNWRSTELPFNCGFRILSLDGGGMRGVVTLTTIQRLENILGQPLVDFFDYIAGTSTGGLIASSLAMKPLDTTATLDLFKSLGSLIFQKKSALTKTAKLALYGYKYDRKQLHDVLFGQFGARPMFSSSSKHKVAVFSCKIDAGELKPVVFPTYNRRTDLTPLPRAELEATIVEALEATSAAGTYFPVFETSYGRFTDGGMLNNNPCEVALKEARAIWWDKDCTLLLSLGTGKWRDPTEQLKSDIPYILSKAVDIMTDTEKSFTNIKQSDKLVKRCFRANPKITQNYGVDSQKVDEMIADAREFPEAELVAIAAEVIAANFYVVPADTRVIHSKEVQAREIARIKQRIDLKSAKPNFEAAIYRGDFEQNWIKVEVKNGTIELVGAPPKTNDFRLEVTCTFRGHKCAIPGANTVFTDSGKPTQ